MKSDSQAAQAYDEIRRRILIAEIRPEERLIERIWSDALNVGRLAVREALTRLQGEGLVTRGTKGGFFAAPMAETDVHEIREIREILEVGAVRVAGSRITDRQIGELEAACDDFAFMVAKGYISGAWEADLRFHRLLVALPGNQRLLRAYERCHIPLFQIRESPEHHEDHARTESEHRAVVEALKQYDVELAAERLRAHIVWGERAVISSLAGPAVPPPADGR